MSTIPKPGIYWFWMDGCRLGRLSYTTKYKKATSAIVETFAGKDRVALDRLTSRIGRGAIAPFDVDKEQAKRFEELLDETDTDDR